MDLRVRKSDACRRNSIRAGQVMWRMERDAVACGSRGQGDHVLLRLEVNEAKEIRRSRDRWMSILCAGNICRYSDRNAATTRHRLPGLLPRGQGILRPMP